MGAIQSAINQAINLGGLLYTQTGQYKAKQEEIAKQKAIKSSEAEVGEKNQVAKEASKGVFTPDSKASSLERQLAASANKALAEAAANAFKLNPTELTKKRAIQARGISDITSWLAENKRRVAPFDANKAKQANMNTANRVNTMSEQKQSVANDMRLLKEDDNG